MSGKLIEAPYPALVIDDFFEPEFFKRLMSESVALKKFHAYDDANARKKTSVPGGVSGIMEDALCFMAASQLMGNKVFPYKAHPDLSFYGAGVSIMQKGDFLKPHVDHAINPVTGFTRVYNFLVYLTACEGGTLRLIGDDAEFRLQPKPNRACFFQSWGDAVHAVETVTGGERVALSVYFYSAEFVPARQNTKAVFL